LQRLKLQIPADRQKVRIIANSDLIQFELNEIAMDKKRYQMKQELEQDTFTDRRQREFREQLRRIKEGEPEEEAVNDSEPQDRPPPEYFQRIQFSNYCDPVQISMEKILPDSIPIDIAAEEIQKAYESGMHDGQLTARSTYKTEIRKYREWINRIDSVVDNLTKNHKSEIDDMRDSLIELSTLIAENIILEEINRDNSRIIDIVKEAIEDLETEKVFTIFLNPDDIDIIRETRSELLKNLPDHKNIEILPDSTLLQGGLLLETTAGMVDARVRTKLEEIKQNLIKSDQKHESTDEIENELNELYQEQMKSSADAKDNSDNRKQLEILRIEDPELYEELVQSGEIESSNDKNEITDEVEKLKAKEHHEEMAKLYGEDVDWDEDKLGDLEKRLQAEDSATEKSEIDNSDTEYDTDTGDRPETDDLRDINE
jgi:flagellar biosynthesis/type III secretory pathway protein FliH